MNPETRSCQNCASQFIIASEDFDFYQKIEVPPPTFCPQCRLQRRLAVRNERTLYKRSCGLCQKDIISIYHKDSPRVVYCSQCWWSDKWDPATYGKEYDFSRPFFEQWKELYERTPIPTLNVLQQTLVNTEYANQVGNLKNCYLLFNSDYSESCAYGTEIEDSKECFDSLMLNGCELCYGSINCSRCYRTFFSVDCEDSQNIWFSKNLVGCSDCFGCVNLRKKRYCIFNQEYSKEEYEKKIAEFSLGSGTNMAELARQAHELHLKFPNKYIHGRQNNGVSGDYVFNSNNVYQSFIVSEAQNCKYCLWMLIKPIKDCWDYTEYGENAQRMYESCNSGANVSDVRFSMFCYQNCARLDYCAHCPGMNDAFGCISMKKSQYCILNKQYSKEEYEALLPKIKEHMTSMPYKDMKGREYRYGEFFPPELSSFGYNETTAQEHFPLTQKEVEEQGYSWRESEERNYQVTLPLASIPDDIASVQEDILQQIIECEHRGSCTHQCTKAFRLIPAELQFLQRIGLPLPRLCPNCRHGERLASRNPLKLESRSCQCAGSASLNKAYTNTTAHFHSDSACTNQFETAYLSSNPSIVYCEQCYQAEVA